MKSSMKGNCEKFLIRQKPFHLQGRIHSLIVDSQNELGNVPSISILWNNLKSIVINSCLKVWQNCELKPSGPEFFGWETLNDCFYFTGSYRSV